VGAVLDSHHLFPGVVDPWGDLAYLGGEGSHLCQKGLPCRGGDRVSCVLRKKAAEDLKGLDSGIPEPSCEEHVMLVVMSCRVGGLVVTASSWHPGDHRASCETVCSYV
jgi:hypothetical protein